MNETENPKKFDHSRFDDIFGGQNADEDVSLENALAASKMQPKKTKKVRYYDPEEGWIEDYVTVDVTYVTKPGSLREVVEQYGETFPETIIVNWMGWDKKEHRITSVSNVSVHSCQAVMDGKETTLNPNTQVTVKIAGNDEPSPIVKYLRSMNWSRNS